MVPDAGVRDPLVAKEALTIEIRGLTKRYSDEGPAAVDDLSLDIGDGEFLTLLGPSGSGKSTLLNMLAGFSTPSRGHIVHGGKDITRLPVHKRNFGMVFQNYALFPHLSAVRNVAFPLRRRGVNKREALKQASEALASVGLAGLEGRKPGQLSGGQQQRVAVARAVVYKPQVVLMDEPFGALDKKLRQELQLEMLRLHRELGRTFVFVTHDQEEALSMSDRVVVLNHGRLQQVGTPSELYSEPATEFVASFIGDSNRFPGVVCVEGSIDTQVGRLIFERGTPVPIGDSAVLIIRPEKVRLCPSETPVPRNANAIRCLISESIFVGASRKVVVRFADGSAGTVVVPADSGDLLSPGCGANFVWAAADGRVVAPSMS